MAWSLIWSPSARLDLRNIFDYIAEDNASAARKFVDGLIQSVEQLPAFPQSGRVPEFQDPAIRELIHASYRIVYRIALQGQRIEIARVWHAARGTPNL